MLNKKNHWCKPLCFKAFHYRVCKCKCLQKNHHLRLVRNNLDAFGHFSKSSWTKTEFIFGFSMKFCLEISYEIFFWTTYQDFRRGQSRKSEDFDQNTKSGLKSSVLGFINRKMAQNGHNKILYMILGIPKSYRELS